MYDGKDCFVQVRQEIDNMEDNTYYTLLMKCLSLSYYLDHHTKQYSKLL